MFDINNELLVWHATALPARAAIEQGGISIINEAVFVALHPAIPIGLYQQFCKEGYVISLLALPHDAWQWGWDGTYELAVNEGYLRKPVPRGNMLEIVDQEEALRRQHLRTADGQPHGAFGDWNRGYAGWLDEDMLIEQCETILRESTNPQRQLQACAYWYFAQEQSRRHGPPIADRLCAILSSAQPLPESAASLAMQIWPHEDPAWISHMAAAVTSRIPFSRICHLWATVCTYGDDESCRQFRENVPEYQQRLDELAKLMALSPHDYGAVITFSQPDAELARILVTLLTHSPMHNARAMAGIAAIAQLPDELADAALLELLRRNRFVRSRARRHVHLALQPRAERLQVELRAIADRFTAGSIRSAAEHIMGLRASDGGKRQSDEEQE